MASRFREDADARHDDLASAVEVTTQRPRPRPASEVFYAETTLAMPTLVNDTVGRAVEEPLRSRKPARKGLVRSDLLTPNADTKRGIAVGVGITITVMAIAFLLAYILVTFFRAR